MGIGSSLILKMNIQTVLKQLGKTDVEVEHCDLTSVQGMNADLIVAAQDIASALRTSTPVIALKNVMSRDELKEKLQDF